MRLREFAAYDSSILEHFYLTEDLLAEEHQALLEYLLNEDEQAIRVKFVDAIKKKLQASADQVVTTVKSTVDALKLFYQVVKDPMILIKAITLLRQAFKQIQKGFHEKIVALISRFVPTTNTLKDFFKLILVYGVVNMIRQYTPQAIAANITQDMATNAIKAMTEKFMNIGKLADGLINSAGSSLMPIVDGLKIAHQMIFNILSNIAANLKSVITRPSGSKFNLFKGFAADQLEEAKKSTLGGWFLIDSNHKRVTAITDKNFEQMSREYASPKPGIGYLGFVDSMGEITHYLMTNHANQIGTIPGKPWD